MENKKVVARDGWEASCVGSTRLWGLCGSPSVVQFDSIRILYRTTISFFLYFHRT